MFGSVSVDLTDYVKNIDYATQSIAGVVRVNDKFGILLGSNGLLMLDPSTSTDVKAGTEAFKTLTPYNQSASTFYGLAKASGHDEKDSELPVGQYTDEAKSSIQDMLDVPSTSELKEVNDSKADVIVESASGDIVSFSDGADDMPLKSLVVDINPIQDLNGYDSPWVGGAGKNLLPCEITKNAPTQIVFDKSKAALLKQGNSYVLSFEEMSNATSWRMAFTIYDENGERINSAGDITTGSFNWNPSGRYYVIGTAGTFKLFKFTVNANYYAMFFLVLGDVTDDSVTVHGQLEIGTEATAWTPYENICPINGWTGVNIEVCGKNLLTTTEYGGTYNGVNGTDLKAMGYAQELIQTGNTVQINIQNTWKGRTFATAPLKAGRYIVGFSCDSSNIRATVYVVDNDFVTKRVYRNVASSGTNLAYPVVEDGERIAVFICSNMVGTLTVTNLVVNLGTTNVNYDSYKGRTINVNWQTEAGTVYGGKLDVLSGVMSIDMAMVDFGTLNWGLASNQFYANLVGAKLGEYNIKSQALCSVYPTLSWAGFLTSGTDKAFAINTGQPRVNVKDSTYTDATTFKTAMSGVQLVYELAEPTEIQLTPQDIKSLLGTNNIWADTGNTSVEYCADTEMYIEKVKPVVNVDDVQINGASIVDENGVANVPVGGSSVLGAVQTNTNFGINAASDGVLYINGANSTDSKTGTNSYRPVVPVRQHESTFYGLAKASGDSTQSASSNAVGNYTEEAKSSIQNMLGITDKYSPKEWIAESETELVANAHSVGDLFYIGEILYKVIADLNAGDAINVGVNVEEINVDNILNDYATKEDVQDNVSIVEKSASGVMVSFDDGADDIPLKELIVDINPVQDLYGYDSPWVGGGGSNKWDEQWEVGSLNSNTGLPVDSTTFIRSKNFCECLPSTEYAKVYSPTSYVNVFWYDENQAFISLSSGGGSNPYSVITSPSNAKYFKIRTESAYGTAYKNDIAINYPSTITTYFPYENICPISGWEGMTVNATGKNLCNAVQSNILEYSSEYAHYTLADGVVVTSGNALMGFIVPVKPSTTYAYSFNKTTGNSLQARVRLFSGHPESFSDKFISQPINTFFSATTTSASVTFTTTADTRYVMVGMYVTGASLTLNNFQVNFGSTATAYEPYNGTTIPINWQTEAGTVYGGKLDVLSGVMTVDHVGCDLSQATEGWVAYGNSRGYYINTRTWLDVPMLSGSWYSDPNTLCDSYPKVNRWADDGVRIGNENVNIYFVGVAEKYPTVNDWISYVTTNGIFVVYPIEPIEVQLDAHTINSLYGQNNIFADTGDTEVEYFSQVDEDLIDYIETSLKPYAKEERLNDYVSDVQINGSSIVTDGVANMPVASTTRMGAIQVGNGLRIDSNKLVTDRPTDALIKSGTNGYRPITPNIQHQSVFYGFAKAAGVDMSSSLNAVGVYTEEAKTAIKQMLGIHDTIDSFIEEVTGTDVTITGQPSYRYNCGEVLSLSITPPSSGTIDFRFTSGSTPTVLTLPQTVKMPEWWVEVEANTIYEMCIIDGIYCGVMTWAM